MQLLHIGIRNTDIYPSPLNKTFSVEASCAWVSACMCVYVLCVFSCHFICITKVVFCTCDWERIPFSYPTNGRSILSLNTFNSILLIQVWSSNLFCVLRDYDGHYEEWKGESCFNTQMIIDSKPCIHHRFMLSMKVLCISYTS